MDHLKEEELMAATHIKSWKGANKNFKKLSGANKEKLEEHFQLIWLTGN